MGTSLMVSIVALGVSTYAWFATAFMDRVLISSGDLTVTQAKFTYYRWAFTKTGGFVIPSTLISGDGAFVSGDKVYKVSRSSYNEGDTDAFTMNTYDPYLSDIWAVYSSEPLNQRTESFVKVDVTVQTSCNFDFALKGVIDSSYTLSDSHGGLLSKYITFRALPGSAFATPTLGSDDQAVYSAFVASFKTNYSGSVYSFSDTLTSIDLASATSVMGGNVDGSVTTTLSYWLCLDYDATKLKTDFSGVDFYASDYTLHQNFYYTLNGTQNGI